MFKDKLLTLTKRFYPRGRAFRIPFNSLLEKQHEGLIESENLALTDSISILDSLIPDNDNFTTEDATTWETRLGLISNNATSLSNRKLAILRKMNHPDDVKSRQHYLFLQRELRAAGFDVYVHENRFTVGGVLVTKTPDEVLVNQVKAVHRTGFKHGQLQHGGIFSDKIVNSIYIDIDKAFNVGSNLRSTFFIGGATVGDYAAIETSRILEFRQLVLKIKPAQTVAYIFINYI